MRQNFKRCNPSISSWETVNGRFLVCELSGGKWRLAGGNHSLRQPAVSLTLPPEKHSGQHLPTAHRARSRMDLHHIKQNEFLASGLTYLTFSLPSFFDTGLKSQSGFLNTEAWQNYLCHLSSNYLRIFSSLFSNLQFCVKIPQRSIFLPAHLSHLTPLLSSSRARCCFLQFLKGALWAADSSTQLLDALAKSTPTWESGIRHFTNFLIGSYVHRSLWTTNYKINKSHHH